MSLSTLPRRILKLALVLSSHLHLGYGLGRDLAVRCVLLLVSEHDQTLPVMAESAKLAYHGQVYALFESVEEVVVEVLISLVSRCPPRDRERPERCRPTVA